MFKKSSAFLKKYALFLFLLPVFFIYSSYNELFGFLPYAFVIKNAVVLSIALILFYLFSYLLYRNKTKAALFTFFTGAYCLLFGFLYDFIKKHLAYTNFDSYTLILPFSLLLLITIGFIIKKSKNSFKGLYLYFNLLLIGLIVSEVPNSIKRYRLDRSVHNLIDFRFLTTLEYKPLSIITDSLKPDIFFIVMDGMASTASMKQALDKDNSALDSLLVQKGFYLVHNAASNYNWTIHSLSTTFNMQYLPDFIAPVMNDPKAYFWGTNSMLHNSLTEILSKEGYQIHQYQPISFNNNQWPRQNYFHDMKDQHFFFKTLPGRIYKDVFWNYTKINLDFIKDIQVSIKNKRSYERKKDIETTTALIKQSCNTLSVPKFVYGHYMIPHDPYVFKSDGSIRLSARQNIGQKTDDLDLYFEQVLYANKIIEDLISYIKINNKKNTVIIIEGDHGYRYLKENTVLNSFRNLNAFYFPDGDYKTLYDSLTPVNTFRIVLNKYFNTQLPLLKDSSIYVTGASNTIIPSKKLPPAHNPSFPDQ